MFPQQPQQQFRTTNANVQLFYRDSTWNKPPGCSQIYMMLIGGGGNGGGGGTGGASGAVTTWWGAAQNVPDILNITVSSGDSVDTRVQYRGSNGLNILLSASGAVNTTAATAMTANQFTASGFFQSVAGQTGAGTTSASTTTFLGAGGGGGGAVANYGYNTAASGSFLLQPVIVGNGSAGTGIRGPIGCGGSSGVGSGGPGLVIIAAW